MSLIQGMVTQLDRQHGCVWTSEDCTDQCYPPPNLQALLKLVLVPHIDNMSVQGLVSIQTQHRQSLLWSILYIIHVLYSVLFQINADIYLIQVVYFLTFMYHSSCTLSWIWRTSCSAKTTSSSLSAMPSLFPPAFPNKSGPSGCSIVDTPRYVTKKQNYIRRVTVSDFDEVIQMSTCKLTVM